MNSRRLRFTNETLNNVIQAQKIGAKTELEKVTISLLEELKQYRDLKEQGLLLRVPCKINQDIYFVPSETNFKLNILNNMAENNRVYHQRICHIVYDGNGYYLECNKELEYGTGRVFIDRHYGEIWFLSQEEAKEKLRELEEDNGTINN